MTVISVEEFRRQQRADYAYRSQLAKTDPQRAASEARARLERAGIIDKAGNFVPTARG